MVVTDQIKIFIAWARSLERILRYVKLLIEITPSLMEEWDNKKSSSHRFEIVYSLN